jgi:hypothetical protein
VVASTEAGWTGSGYTLFPSINGGNIAVKLKATTIGWGGPNIDAFYVM